MREKQDYKTFILFALAIIIFGFIVSDIRQIITGIKDILLINDILITDYIKTSGIGAAFVNSGIVTLISVLLMYFNRLPVTGYTYVVIALMCGFSLFGKNFLNIWFILFGTYIYSRLKKEEFSKYVNLALLSTGLSPIISSLFLSNGITIESSILSIFVGITIGIVMPALATYTATLHKGYNLYNSGFAAGLLALILVPVMKSYGMEIKTTLHWSTGNNNLLSTFLYSVCIILIILGIISDKSTLKNYKSLLKEEGRAPTDFLELYGKGTVYVNMGINGIMSVSYILIIGGDLNGPTMGAIVTIMGFSAFGKHIKNTIPIMFGVFIGGLTKQWSLTDPSVQLAALFSTTLAPIAGKYGWIAGIFVGFIHSSVVLHAGIAYDGVNLYNNGFAGGIVVIVLLPIIEEFFNILESRKTKKALHK